jgi:hypothetical protein
VPFIVKAYVDGHAFTATMETAKDAFAKAIEWNVVGKLTNVSISDGTRSCSIAEFASVMALAEIAGTINTNVNPNNSKVSGSSRPRSTSTALIGHAIHDGAGRVPAPDRVRTTEKLSARQVFFAMGRSSFFYVIIEQRFAERCQTCNFAVALIKISIL